MIMFQYSLHSIPCIGFEVFFGGKSIAFTVRSDRPHTTLRSAAAAAASLQQSRPQAYSRVLFCF